MIRLEQEVMQIKQNKHTFAGIFRILLFVLLIHFVLDNYILGSLGWHNFLDDAIFAREVAIETYEIGRDFYIHIVD